MKVTTNIHMGPDTDVRAPEWADAFLDIADGGNQLSLFLGYDDTDRLTNIDKLAEALLDIRTRCMERMAAKPEPALGLTESEARLMDGNRSMAGTLDLTPWAREEIAEEERADVVAAIPDGYTLGVNHDRQRRQWVFWKKDPDGVTSHQLRVSGSMSLRAACFYALRHWHLSTDTVVTVDAEGYIRSITDAE